MQQRQHYSLSQYQIDLSMAIKKRGDVLEDRKQ